MEKYLIPVLAVTGYLLVYIISIGMNLQVGFILFMFSLSPILILWMVYKVLRANIIVNHTFEEKWYDDFATKKEMCQKGVS
ncbi:MAG TPA: hypothetical protein VK014_07935 [Cyclobacteriaceae bacterium]|nr:hypothetical protein [Cyclobacteriaceae bacterium]